MGEIDTTLKEQAILNRVYDDTTKALRTSISSNMPTPKHDRQVIDESAAPATTIITYSLLGVTVATKTITVSGTTTTISMTYE